MMTPPPPSYGYRSGAVRLAGFGGAQVMLRSGVVPGDEGPVLTVDVGFLTPTEYEWIMRRPMTPGLSQRLAEFFFACANKFEPASVVQPVVDELSGLQVRVLSSDDSRVELEIQVEHEELERSDGLAGLCFMTSRLGLTLVADQVTVLESAVDWSGGWIDDVSV